MLIFFWKKFYFDGFEAQNYVKFVFQDNKMWKISPAAPKIILLNPKTIFEWDIQKKTYMFFGG